MAQPELWEYGGDLSRVTLIHEDGTATSPRDRLYYAGKDALYGAWIADSPCSEVYTDSRTGDELESRQISEVLIEAAGVTGSDTECFGSLGLAQLQVDQEGDLWVAFQASGGARVCRYYLDAGTAACSTLDLDRCSAFAVSRDGSRFACSVSDYADDEERVSVFDAATAAQVDELAFSSDGAWHFFDNDTIAVLDGDLELTTISIG